MLSVSGRPSELTPSVAAGLEHIYDYLVGPAAANFLLLLGFSGDDVSAFA